MERSATTLQTEENARVNVLVSLEYQGVAYGGWQRQGIHNRTKYPSIQESLEEAATVACQDFSTEECFLHGKTVAVASCGRTDRAVHALQHYCVLKLPLSQTLLTSSTQNLQDWILGISDNVGNHHPAKNKTVESSPFLSALNQALPLDIAIQTCRIITNKQRLSLRFPRKRYRYLIHQPPCDHRRPIHVWHDYCSFVPQPLDVVAMQNAAADFVGTHDFQHVACHTDRRTVRTIHQATVSCVPLNETVTGKHHNSTRDDNFPTQQQLAQPSETPRTIDSIPWFRIARRTATTTKNCSHRALPLPTVSTAANHGLESLLLPTHPTTDDDNHWRQGHEMICIEVCGDGFLRHQVRRMVTILCQVGAGRWPVHSVRDLLNAGSSEPRFFDLSRVKNSSAPGRGLYLDQAWLELDEHDA